MIIIRNPLFRCSGAYVLLIIPFLFLLIVQSANSQPASSTVYNDTIKIGLLITVDTSESAQTKQAVDVVNLVLDQVNATGGIRGKNIELFVKSVDGNWGAGSKQSVSLIYEDEVSALLGFVDGRSSHLIEQVCTKAQIPFISTFSPDPTLSQINIPWFFSSIPNADQQSKVLAGEIYGKQHRGNVTIISSDDYDHRHLTQSFLREAEADGVPAPVVITYQSGGDEFHQLALEIPASESDAIVFFGFPEEWKALISQLHSNKYQKPIFLPIIELDEVFISDSTIPVFTITPGNWDLEEGKNFQEVFYTRYGYQPGFFASYIYDGTIALLEAIKINGTDNTEIQEGLVGINFNGISGQVSFDPTGLRKGELKLVQVSTY